MSVVEDSRKLVRDFLTPELRGIAARLDALEKRADTIEHKVGDVDRRSEKRDDSLGSKLDKLDGKLDEYARRAEIRHEQVLELLRKASDISDVRERLARLEENQRWSRLEATRDTQSSAA